MKKYKYIYVMQCLNVNDIEHHVVIDGQPQPKKWKHPLYKIGVTNCLVKRIQWYKANGYEMTILKAWRSKGGYAKLIEDMFFKELFTPFNSDKVRCGLKSEWFCDQNHMFCQESTLREVMNFINSFSIKAAPKKRQVDFLCKNTARKINSLFAINGCYVL